jgi:hypothetical protein
MRMILRDIINSEFRTLKELGLENKTIKRVYTIINEEEMYAKFNPQTGKPCEKSLDNLILKHWSTVFVEDKMHDWNIFGDRFKFHAHSSGMGEKVDLLIEYE